MFQRRDKSNGASLFVHTSYKKRKSVELTKVRAYGTPKSCSFRLFGITCSDVTFIYAKAMIQDNYAFVYNYIPRVVLEPKIING